MTKGAEDTYIIRVVSDRLEVSVANVAVICRRHHGNPTWPFSQTSFAVLKRIFSDPKTRWGICAALSVHWIREHADGGTLATLLGGGGLGSINVPKLREIAVLQSEASQGTGDEQQQALTQWLRAANIVPVTKSMTIKSDAMRFKQRYPAGWKGGSTEVERTDSREKQRRFEDITQELTDEMMHHENCYMRVNFGGTCMGRPAAHAIAVFIGQKNKISDGDAIMFDPNYGEFWFEEKAHFATFFPEFYRAKYLSGAFAFNRSLGVLPCNRLDPSVARLLN
jgi:hypothetical protein